MSEILASVQKLIDEEHFHGENSTEIQDLLVDYLVLNINENPQADYNELAKILSDIDYLAEIEVDTIIIKAKEKTCDEKKLIAEGIVIFTAKQAAESAERFRKEYDELVFSGLNRFRINVMLAIRSGVIAGENKIYYSDNYCSDNIFAEELKWLQNLGFAVRELTTGIRRYEISW